MRYVLLVALLAQFNFCPLAAAEVQMPRVLDDRLQLELVAAEPDIVTPTGIAVDQRGRVLVIESHTHFRPDDYQGPPADRIRSFEDRDGDGKYESIGTFFEGTTATMSLAEYHDGSFYVATRSEVFRLRDTDGDGRADERTPIVRLETPGNYPHNGLSGFAFDDRGQVVFGFGENLGAEYKLVGSDGTTLSGGGEGGNIYSCAPDGSQLKQIASGFWNPFHLCFDAFGRLFTVDNDPDSRPPCRLLHVVEGGDYGYRFRNGRKGLHPFTAWNGELPGTLPMVAGTGEAPSGILSYESDNLPRDYLGNLLVTSWGDHRLERYRLTPRGASFVSTMEPVVIGGENFRPVGIALAPDGSLYISDWVDKSYKLHGKGRIWRLRAESAAKPKRPAEPRDALESLHRPLREQAARQLAQTAEGQKRLAEVVASGTDDRVRATALLALALVDAPEVNFRQLIAASSADLGALAARIAPASRIATSQFLGDFGTLPAEVRAALVSRAMREGEMADICLAAARDVDPFVRHAVMAGWLPGQRRSTLLAWRQSDEPLERLAAALVSRSVASPDSTKAIGDLLSDADPDVQLVAVQWVAEQRLVRFRQRLWQGLSSPGMPRRLFDAHLAALTMLDGEEPKTFDQDGGQTYVARLIEDVNTPNPTKTRALGMLRPNHPALTLDRLQAFLNSTDQALALAAIRSMREGSPEARQAMFAAVLSQESRFGERAVCEAVMALSPDDATQRQRLLDYCEHASATIRQEALRTLRGTKLSSPERRRLAESLGSRKRQTTDTMAAEQDLLDLIEPQESPPTGDRSHAEIDAWMNRLEGPADPVAGERIFFHARAAGCARCHQIEGRGGSVGPDLSAMAQVLDRRRLVESILAPSKEVAPLFVPWTIQTTDGRVLTGLLVEEALDGQQTYADAQGRTFVLKPEEIDLRQPHAQSLMPAGLERNLTLQEFRDLLAYLQARK
jgi:putative membrane-bound dehydrogenase-like protein